MAAKYDSLIQLAYLVSNLMVAKWLVVVHRHNRAEAQVKAAIFSVVFRSRHIEMTESVDLETCYCWRYLCTWYCAPVRYDLFEFIYLNITILGSYR